MIFLLIYLYLREKKDFSCSTLRKKKTKQNLLSREVAYGDTGNKLLTCYFQ